MDLKALHATKSIKARPDRKRLGRGPGSGLGKTSSRGQKGAKSRTGHHKRDFYEGGQTPLMRRIPKRGFSNDRFGQTFAVINVADLNCFDEGTEVDPRLLEETGLVKQPLDGVKVLGDGDLERKLVVKAHRFSKSALAKIQAKGGEAIALLAPKPRKVRRPAAAPGATPQPKKQKKTEGEAAAPGAPAGEARRGPE